MCNYMEKVRGTFWRIQGSSCSLESLVWMRESKVPCNKQEGFNGGNVSRNAVLHLHFIYQYYVWFHKERGKGGWKRNSSLPFQVLVIIYGQLFGIIEREIKETCFSLHFIVVCYPSVLTSPLILLSCIAREITLTSSRLLFLLSPFSFQIVLLWKLYQERERGGNGETYFLSFSFIFVMRTSSILLRFWQKTSLLSGLKFNLIPVVYHLTKKHPCVLKH